MRGLANTYMWLTIIVFLHLIATCAAIGVIVITDMWLMAKVLGLESSVVIPPPERFDIVMISASLLVLYATGTVLVVMGLAANPE